MYAVHRRACGAYIHPVLGRDKEINQYVGRIGLCQSSARQFPAYRVHQHRAHRRSRTVVAVRAERLHEIESLEVR